MATRLRMFFCLIAAVGGAATPAAAQPGGDPRPMLFQLIAAFQQGGAQPAFQSLSPAMYQTVWSETGGRGFYPLLAQLGLVTGGTVHGRQEFPVGPVYAVRVQHQFGASDWYIGFNRLTNRIEYFASQPAVSNQPEPRLDTPPPPRIDAPPPRQEPRDTPAKTPPSKPTESTAGCDLYPTMCK
jgi:hypothetical protein